MRVIDLADRLHRRCLEAHPLEATILGIAGFDALVPDDSEEGAERLRNDVSGFLTHIDAIDTAGVTPPEAVTLDCARERGRLELAGIDAAPAEHTVTSLPFSGPAELLAVAASAVLIDAAAADDYIERLQRSGAWIDQLSTRLQTGAARGRLPVARLVQRAIAWSEEVLEAPVPTALLAAEPPRGWSGAPAWEQRRQSVAGGVVKPALARWRDTLRELLPRARPQDRAGLLFLPGGADDYAAMVLVHTTLQLTPQQVHESGLEAVRYLQDKAVRLGRELGLSTFAEVRDAVRQSSHDVAPELAIRAAREAIRRAELIAPRYFPGPMPAPCAVSPMPSVAATSGAPPYYTPPRDDGSRPGTFWFNAERAVVGAGWELESVAFHEAVPGHHLQLARLRLLDHLPALQREQYFSAFGEGWGLYAEELAEETGLYSNVPSLLGAVGTALMRAARLVVDTGIHAFGWSREQAVRYAMEHVPASPESLEGEVDRYIAMPGQALSYMTGKQEIMRLRELAQERLGDRFHLAAFHGAVLDQGSLPLAVLGRSVAAWIDTQQRGRD